METCWEMRKEREKMVAEDKEIGKGKCTRKEAKEEQTEKVNEETIGTKVKPK